MQNPTHYGEFLIKTPWIISDATANWNWEGMEGKPVIVEVYAAGEEVELFLNGASLGKKTAGKEAGFRTLFETTYEPGSLMAVSYENGQETGRSELATAGTDRSLVIEQEAYAGIEETEQELFGGRAQIIVKKPVGEAILNVIAEDGTTGKLKL